MHPDHTTHMTYDEAYDTNPTISRAKALREVAKHQCDAGEFIADVGDRETYGARDVLAWLGY